MSMLNCPICENACSPDAQMCPRRGHPLTTQLTHPPHDPLQQLQEALNDTANNPIRHRVIVRPVQSVQTIEKTGKVWKLQILLGGLLIFFSLIFFLLSGRISPIFAALSVICFLIGLLMLFVGKPGAWWFHG